SARAARDGELRIVQVVIERPFDGQAAVVEKYRPVALPRLADVGANAVSLIAPDLLRVARVEDRVAESEHVAQTVARRPHIRHGVGVGVLDDGELVLAAVTVSVDGADADGQ